MQYILKDKTRDDRYLREVKDDLIYNTPYPGVAMRFSGKKFAVALTQEHDLENYIVVPLDEA